jgi:hypothetical protein
MRALGPKFAASATDLMTAIAVGINGLSWVNMDVNGATLGPASASMHSELTRGKLKEGLKRRSVPVSLFSQPSHLSKRRGLSLQSAITDFCRGARATRFQFVESFLCA